MSLIEINKQWKAFEVLQFLEEESGSVDFFFFVIIVTENR